MTKTKQNQNQNRAADHTHERLAATAALTDDGGGTYEIRGVAIGENDVTGGQSGERTRWPPAVLEAAAETLAGQETPLVRGPGGKTAHWPLEEQVPPEALVGSVRFDYTPGAGLTFDGEVVDETVARQVDLELLEVSPDLLRSLADETGSDGVTDVEEILAVPRVTLVEQGAGPSASVELSGGRPEALAECLATPPEDDRTDAEVEQLATSALTMGDVLEASGDDLTAREYLEQKYGVDASAFGDETELLSTVRKVREARRC